jgi:peptidyl-tRNA hydrolase, PTH1 family
MWLVVGLGNPGAEYAANRHNVGFQVLDEFAARVACPALRLKFGAAIGEGTLGDERILLCKPMEFMNVSGQATARVAKFWKVAVENTVVVHDDLDLPFGRLKLGAGGGHGGNNGVRSLIAELGPEFRRVRFGVGRPPAGRDPADYVLHDFAKAEQKDLPDLRITACNAIEAIITQGLTAAMNKFNTKSKNAKDTDEDGP